jgi:flavin reductase (DIM6/NTAB) family NADH-FMN oxidoreductase RutF
MSGKAIPVDGLPGIDSRLYRRTCARFATGITVVTTLDSHGHPHGMTVNSFSSVSLDPPPEHQENLSRRFSSPSENRFRELNWHAGTSGTPLLDGVLGQLECSVVQTFDAGDHTVLIGEVRSACHTEGKPLVYFDSAYRSLQQH